MKKVAAPLLAVLVLSGCAAGGTVAPNAQADTSGSESWNCSWQVQNDGSVEMGEC